MRRYGDSAGRFSVESVIPETRFFDADLKDAEPLDFASPPGIKDLAADLRSLHMLVLGGNNFEDKPIFARHLAWILRESLQKAAVKQWQPSLSSVNFDEAIRQFEAATILLFPGVYPHQIGHDLRRLHAVVSDRGHYAIVTTESTIEDWTSGIELLEQSFWRNLETTCIYDAEFLFGRFDIELDERGMPRPETGLFPEGHDSPEKSIIAGLTIGEAVKRLKTPSRIRSFLDFLRSRREKVSLEAILDLLDQLGGDSHAVSRWYRRLDVRQQSLALGFSLFHGLFRDQAFAALEVLVEAGWRARDPGFAHFDYHELPVLTDYFQGTGSRAANPPIEAVSQRHRLDILMAGWELHRRRMVVTLPILARIVTEAAPYLNSTPSAGTAEQNGRDGTEDAEGVHKTEGREEPKLSGWHAHGPARELFGSSAHVLQIHRAISEAFSLIGILSFQAVEPSLLQLAAHHHVAVQSVSAAAVARWRELESGKEQKNLFFETLERWQNEAFVFEVMHRISGHPGADFFAHVRATVAVAVSYGALYDHCNELNSRLVELIDRLYNDRNSSVCDRFHCHTIPFVTARHLGQMEIFLRQKVVNRVEFHEGLAVGLAAALLVQPERAREILNRWYHECRVEKLETPPGLSLRDKTLAVVALTYGHADGDAAVGGIVRREIFARLEEILRDERGSFVRQRALRALVLQAGRNFAATEMSLQTALDLVAATNRGESELREERDYIVNELTELYLLQRMKLTGGDETLFLNDPPRSFSIWLDQEKRPRTEVEEVMQRWWVGDKRAARQVATRALKAFSETWLENRERLRREKHNATVHTQEPLAPQKVPPPPRTLTLAPFLGRIAVFLITLGSSRERRAVEDHFAELLALSQNSRGLPINPENTLDEILSGFKLPSSVAAKRIGTRLRRAFWLYRHRRPIVMALGTLLTACAVWLLLA